MVEFFSNLIGPYPYEKLALVQSSTRYGGMENSSSVFLAENVFSEGTNSHGSPTSGSAIRSPKRIGITCG